jgi:hypothetical protein
VGLLTTVGLATKNAILIVEFAKEHFDDGATLARAALHASKERLRPILMTSLAFIFGTLPLAVATGAGAGAHVAIGTAVIGGMTGPHSWRSSSSRSSSSLSLASSGCGRTVLSRNEWRKSRGLNHETIYPSCLFGTPLVSCLLIINDRGRMRRGTCLGTGSTVRSITEHFSWWQSLEELADRTDSRSIGVVLVRH